MQYIYHLYIGLLYQCFIFFDDKMCGKNLSNIKFLSDYAQNIVGFLSVAHLINDKTKKTMSSMEALFCRLYFFSDRVIYKARIDTGDKEERQQKAK